jgi:hypothetical protein
MLSFGTYLLVSVAMASPAAPLHAAEKLASTYEEAACDVTDSGECAVEADLEELPLPTLAEILDCESPYVQEMIGSCDMPKPTLPSLHLPTLQKGVAAGLALTTPSGRRISVATPAPSLDFALPPLSHIAAALAPVTSLLDLAYMPTLEPHPSRLDRPPRV